MLNVLAAGQALLPGWPFGHPQSLLTDTQMSGALQVSPMCLHSGHGTMGWCSAAEMAGGLMPSLDSFTSFLLVCRSSLAELSTVSQHSIITRSLPPQHPALIQ